MQNIYVNFRVESTQGWRCGFQDLGTTYTSADLVALVGDSRFDKIKHQPARFTAFWIGQGTLMIRVVEIPL
jgi:hypothetical protein